MFLRSELVSVRILIALPNIISVDEKRKLLDDGMRSILGALHG